MIISSLTKSFNSRVRVRQKGKICLFADILSQNALLVNIFTLIICEIETAVLYGVHRNGAKLPESARFLCAEKLVSHFFCKKTKSGIWQVVYITETQTKGSDKMTWINIEFGGRQGDLEGGTWH